MEANEGEQTMPDETAKTRPASARSLVARALRLLAQLAEVVKQLGEGASRGDETAAAKEPAAANETAAAKEPAAANETAAANGVQSIEATAAHKQPSATTEATATADAVQYCGMCGNDQVQRTYTSDDDMTRLTCNRCGHMWPLPSGSRVKSATPATTP